MVILVVTLRCMTLGVTDKVILALFSNASIRLSISVISDAHSSALLLADSAIVPMLDMSDLTASILLLMSNMSDAHSSALLLADSAIVPMLDMSDLTASILLLMSNMSDAHSSALLLADSAVAPMSDKSDLTELISKDNELIEDDNERICSFMPAMNSLSAPMERSHSTSERSVSPLK